MADLTCQDFVELVTDYLEGALDEDTVRRFEEPIESDAVMQVMEHAQKLVKVLPPDAVSYDDANNRALISGKCSDLESALGVGGGQAGRAGRGGR